MGEQVIAEHRAPRGYSQPRTGDEEVARGAIVYNKRRARVDQRRAQVSGQHQLTNQYHRKEQHGNDLRSLCFSDSQTARIKTSATLTNSLG